MHFDSQNRLYIENPMGVERYGYARYECLEDWLYAKTLPTKYVTKEEAESDMSRRVMVVIDLKIDGERKRIVTDEEGNMSDGKSASEYIQNLQKNHRVTFSYKTIGI